LEKTAGSRCKKWRKKKRRGKEVQKSNVLGERAG